MADREDLDIEEERRDLEGGTRDQIRMAGLALLEEVERLRAERDALRGFSVHRGGPLTLQLRCYGCAAVLLLFLPGDPSLLGHTSLLGLTRLATEHQCEEATDG